MLAGPAGESTASQKGWSHHASKRSTAAAEGRSPLARACSGRYQEATEQSGDIHELSPAI